MPTKRRRFSAGPFKGMLYDAAQLDHWDPSLVYQAKNMIRTPAGAYARRPSDRAVDSGVTGLSQWVGLFERTAGTLNVAIIGGEIYTIAGHAPTFTKVVTTANLATAGITLTSTLPNVFACTFTDNLVINDQVNQPFMWDGTTGAGGLTLLSNAPSKCAGPPTVYYGKLFFVKFTATTDKDTIVWSEENSPNTGYEAGGFSNVWRLSQSGAGPIVAVQATNQALYYWRANSIGTIRGAVTTDFTASGVHDDVSVGIGTSQPQSFTAVGADILFLDQFTRPWRLAGGQLLPLWEQITDLFDPVGAGLVGGAFQWSNSTYIPYFNYAVFSIYDAIAGYARFFVFDFATNRLIAEWSFDDGLDLVSNTHYTHIGRYFDELRGTNGAACLIVLRGRDTTTNVMAYITPPDSQSVQFLSAASSSQPTTWSLTLGPIGNDSGRQWRFDELHAELDVNGGTASATVSLAVNDTLDFSGDATVGSITIGAQSARRRRRAAWGLAREQRMLVPKISGNADLAYWAVAAVHALAFEVPFHPSVT